MLTGGCFLYVLLAVALIRLQAQQPFKGDILVSTATGQVLQYSPGGQLRRTVTVAASGDLTGSAFDTDGNFYVTDFGGVGVFKFDPGLRSPHPFGSAYEGNPESVLLDASGSIFVGASNADAIKKFSPQGVLLETYRVETDRRGADWIDLARDQRTMYYTSEGSKVKRFDIRANRQLPDFAQEGNTLFALRILAGGNVLVANTSNVLLLASNGHVLRTDLSGATRLFALNLDPDGVSYWTAEENSGEIYRIEIATGKVLKTIETHVGIGGISVWGEQTASSNSDWGLPETIIGAVTVFIILDPLRRLWRARLRRHTKSDEHPPRPEEVNERGFSVDVKGEITGGAVPAYRVAIRSVKTK
jgi:DNA-binding beta-propeller fold protein YncE